MTLTDAFILLSIDYKSYYLKLGNSSRSEKIKLVTQMLDYAKRQSKYLMAKNHPDKGGDPILFKKINDASQLIQSNSDEFIAKMTRIIEEEALKAESRIFISTK